MTTTEYVDCRCIACGWNDGFKSAAITQGLAGGWCGQCNREAVFRVSNRQENKDATTAQEQLEWIWENCEIVRWPKGNGAAFTLNPIPRKYSSGIVEAEMNRTLISTHPKPLKNP